MPVVRPSAVSAFPYTRNKKQITPFLLIKLSMSKCYGVYIDFCKDASLPNTKKNHCLNFFSFFIILNFLNNIKVTYNLTFCFVVK